MTGLYLGAISGTSVDGLDLALLEYLEGGPPRTLAATTTPLPEPLREQLLALGQSSLAGDQIDALGYAGAALGEFIASAALTFLNAKGIEPGAIAAIGSHGQTIRHRPDQDTQGPPFTLQIGDPHRIAERTGITTVADFRGRDVAAGGQGAPLVPPFHSALFADPQHTVVAVNIGGISNISVLTPNQPVRGYDTGPGNCLMDEWCHQHTGQSYDASGRWGASGQVLTPLLNAGLNDPYFAAPAPKSTGREYFNPAWLEPLLSSHPSAAPQDIQATLCELTAACIAKEVAPLQPARLIVCGGGRLNGHLMSRLQALVSCPVVPSEDMQVDGDYIEAAAFAWLAARTLAQLPGNEAHVTGAAGARVLGTIYRA